MDSAQAVEASTARSGAIRIRTRARTRAHALAHPRGAASPYAALLVACLIGAGLTGCITIGAKPSDAKSRVYDVAPPTGAWVPVDAGTADTAFRSADGEATLAVNSVCDQYQKLSLEELAETSLAGLSVREERTREGLLVGGIPGLGKDVEGTLDGKPFRMALTVVRGPRCVYDLTLIAPPDAYARHEAAYAAFLSGFRVEGIDGSSTPPVEGQALGSAMR